MALKSLPEGSHFSVAAEVRTDTGTDRARIVMELLGTASDVGLADAGLDQISIVAHPFANDDIIQFTSTDTLPGGISANLDYVVANATANTFQLSLTVGGAIVDITSAGTGTIQVTPILVREFGTEVQVDSYGVEFSEIADVITPAGVEAARGWVENLDATENAYAQKIMFNLGPVPLPFAEPVLIINAHDARDLAYSSGAVVNDLEPAESGAERTTNAPTDILIDTAGFSQNAHWGSDTLQASLPSTLAGHNIQDGQTLLPEASADEQVLHKDTTGDFYLADKYGTEMNVGVHAPLHGLGSTAVPTVDYGQMGTEVVIENPGQAVAISVIGSGCFSIGGEDPSQTDNVISVRMEISYDGGATYTVGAGKLARAQLLTSEYDSVGSNSATAFAHVVPTGDIHIRMLMLQVQGTASVVALADYTSFLFIVTPRSEYSTVSGPLVVGYPTSKFGSCSKAYTSGTTCTAAVEITASPSGGTPGYSYSHFQDSGTTMVLTGATSKTCTVSDTNTTADGGADFISVFKCTVTDADLTQTTSTGCTVTLEYIRTYTDITVSAPNKEFTCGYTSASLPQSCTASGQLDCSVSGGDENYSFSWSITGNAVFTSGATTQTPTVEHTADQPSGGGPYVETATVDVSDGHSNADSDTAQVEFNHILVS